MLHQTNFLHQMLFFRQLQQKIKTLIISQGIELIFSDNVYRDTGNLMAFEFQKLVQKTKSYGCYTKQTFYTKFFFRQLQQKIKTLIISQGIELIFSDNVYRDTGNLMAFEFQKLVYKTRSYGCYTKQTFYTKCYFSANCNKKLKR